MHDKVSSAQASQARQARQERTAAAQKKPVSKLAEPRLEAGSVLAGADPSTQAAALARADGAARGRFTLQLQQQHGNTYVQRLVSELDLSQQIRSAASGGSNLDQEVRARLEPGLGADLSRVRVHTDAEADRLARQVNAVAFTNGEDIFFRAGTYNPASAEGLRLVAHEAAHTVQQTQGPVAGTEAPGGVSISDPADSFEQAAEQAADAVMAGTSQRPAQGTPTGATPGLAVQRDEWWQETEEKGWPDIAMDVLTDDVLGGAIDFADAGNIGGMGTLGGVLGPLGALGGGLDIYDAVTEPGTFGLENLTDVGRGALNIGSGATSFLTMAGVLPEVAGATAVGSIGAAGGAAGAASLASAGGMVASAGLAGYGVGRLLDEGAGEIGELFGGREDEYNLSSMGADAMTSIDQSATGALRSLGVLDESEPEYTQTLGWQLAEILPSWLQ